MLNIIKKFIFVFKYGDELEKLLKQIKKETEEKIRIAEKDNLHLCIRHKQEKNHSHYSERNCDYCKLEYKLKINKIY